METLAEVTQTPVDLGGCIALSTLSAATVGRIEISLGAWVEPANTYMAVVLPPGERKTEVVERLGTGPMGRLEARLVQNTHPTIVEAQFRRDIAEKAVAEFKKSATLDTIGDLTQLQLAADAIVVPSRPRLLAGDVTPEKLVGMLAEQSGRLAVLDDEGGLIAAIAGRYSGRSAGPAPIENVLKAHTATSIAVDRVGRGSEYVERATLTIGIAVQPRTLQDLGEIPGGKERGLWARILWAIPQPMAGYRQVHVSPVAASDLQGHLLAWEDTLRRVVDGCWDLEIPRRLHLSPEARAAFDEWRETAEVELRPGGRLGSSDELRGWGSKLPGAVGRLAAVLHAAEYPPVHRVEARPVPVETIRRAITLGDYFADMACLAVDEMGADEALIDAERVLVWLDGQGWPDQVTERDVQRHARVGRSKARAGAAVARLIDLGWLRRAEKEEGKVGRPSELLDVSPLASEHYVGRSR